MSDEQKFSKPQPFLVALLLRLFKERRLGAASAAVILVLVVVGILAEIVAPFPYNEMHLVDRLSGPPAPTCWAPTSSAASC